MSVPSGKEEINPPTQPVSRIAVSDSNSSTFAERMKAATEKKNNTLHMVSRTGIGLVLNTTRELSQHFGFHFLQRIRTGVGIGVVVGVTKREDERNHLHVILDKDKFYVSYWNIAHDERTLIHTCGFELISVSEYPIPTEAMKALVAGLQLPYEESKEILGIPFSEEDYTIVKEITNPVTADPLKHISFTTHSSPSSPSSYQNSPSSFHSFESKPQYESFTQPNYQIYKCPICSKEFGSNYTLNEHLDKGHFVDDTEKITERFGNLDINFNFKDPSIIFHEALNANEPAKMEKFDEDLVKAFEGATSPINGPALRVLIPQLAAKESREKNFSKLKPEQWEMIFGTYLSLPRKSSLPMEEVALILELSLQHSMNKLKEVLSEILFSNNLLKTWEMAIQHESLEKVRDECIKQIQKKYTYAQVWSLPEYLKLDKQLQEILGRLLIQSPAEPKVEDKAPKKSNEVQMRDDFFENDSMEEDPLEEEDEDEDVVEDEEPLEEDGDE